MNDKWETRIVNSLNRLPWKMRKYIYKLLGVSSEGEYFIGAGGFFDSVKSIKLGKNVFVNRNVQFHVGGSNSKARISLLDNVSVGMNTCFICVSHILRNPSKRMGENVYSDIRVEPGAWICANVIVLPGVRIGSGCVIAAGSVVVSDCEDNYLYAGNPAKKKKFLGDKNTSREGYKA